MAARSALSTPSGAAPHRLAADQDLFERDLERIGMAPQINAHGIAHGKKIGAGALGDPRDLVVPGDEADAFLAVALHLLQRGDGDRLVGRHGFLFRSARPYVHGCM